MRGRVEGVGGITELLPSSAGLELPANGGHPNSAGILPTCAPQMFDEMPVRNPTWNNVYEIPLEAREVWERGPEHVVRDGSSLRAIFSSSTPEESSEGSGDGSSDSEGSMVSAASSAGSTGASTDSSAPPDVETGSEDEDSAPRSNSGAAGRPPLLGGAAVQIAAGSPVAGPTTMNPLPTRPMHPGGLKEGMKGSKKKLGKGDLEIRFARGKGTNIAQNLPENSELAVKLSYA